jgi:hypothetical protein
MNNLQILIELQEPDTLRKQVKATKKYHLVETYSVYGGKLLVSLASPRSAILIVFLTNSKFSDGFSRKNASYPVSCLYEKIPFYAYILILEAFQT